MNQLRSLRSAREVPPNHHVVGPGVLRVGVNGGRSWHLYRGWFLACQASFVKIAPEGVQVLEHQNSARSSTRSTLLYPEEERQVMEKFITVGGQILYVLGTATLTGGGVALGFNLLKPKQTRMDRVVQLAEKTSVVLGAVGAVGATATLGYKLWTFATDKNIRAEEQALKAKERQVKAQELHVKELELKAKEAKFSAAGATPVADAAEDLGIDPAAIPTRRRESRR